MKNELEKCIKKEISEFELDDLISGKIKAPNYEVQEYCSACYDCDGYNTTCPLYETEQQHNEDAIFTYDSFLVSRIYQFKRGKK